jgi:hypothetical protein
MKWDDFKHVSTRHILYVLRGIAPGSKNKDAPTREYTRRTVSSEHALHPIYMLCLTRDAVRKYADRNRMPRQPLVWLFGNCRQNVPFFPV